MSSQMRYNLSYRKNVYRASSFPYAIQDIFMPPSAPQDPEIRGAVCKLEVITKTTIQRARKLWRREVNEPPAVD